jgi:hypothetical protein
VAGPPPTVAVAGDDGLGERVARLEAEVSGLRSALEALRRELGASEG